MVCNICALLATLAATFLLGLPFPLNFQIILFGAAALGVTASYIFSTIEFDQSPPKQQAAHAFSTRVKVFLSEVGSQKSFRSYVVSSLIWSFGVNLASSFFVVYYVGDLGGPQSYWAVISGVNLATQVLVQRYWGRLADRFGQRNVMLASGALAAVLPLLWALTRNSWFPFVIYALNGVAWGGYNLAAFNLILEITPDHNRTVYVAGYNTLMGIATAIGPLVGGFAAEAFGLRPVFLSSTLFRALGLYVFYRSVQDTSQKQMSLRDLIPSRKSAGF
jgi:Na+/melibiose symporter-like transporter